MDCLVVGCGLTGSVIARELAECGKKVGIWERRGHIGGNMYDYIDRHGFLVQKYGPHTFHTRGIHVSQSTRSSRYKTSLVVAMRWSILCRIAKGRKGSHIIQF